ncbi:MAG TPA: phosphoribosyltransferase family protein [Kribbellaceae bacterium]|nr:phosphoribosyltransferase family protein [Kribbellaceae bacterium]
MAGRRFSDRADAGRQLADRLARTVVAALGPVVLGLPRGGVPVAAEVAKGLRAPLDVLVIRKVGVPWQPELAVGAVGEGGIRVVNSEIFRSTGLTEAELDGLVARAAAEVEERVRGFRAGRAAVEVAGLDVVLVDDGIATGATMHAAVEVVRARGALTVTVATPVAAVQSLERLRPVADRIVCLLEPSDLRGVGLWYRDFTQTSDSEVAELLSKAGEAG